MADTLTKIRIGPEHAGTRMSLEDFARAVGRKGYFYELEKGTVVVMEIPDLPHMLVGQFVREELTALKRGHPGLIFYIGGDLQSKVQLPEEESERHPDLTVYLNPPPVDDDQPWEFWTPDIVIEIVSQRSAERDYKTKADEYLKAGVRLYWIFDPRDRTATTMMRRGDRWQTKRFDATGTISTRMLPGFELKLADVFAVLD